MERRPIKKLYYKIDFTLASSLALGSGEENYTDKDIARDSSGVPYIPGTSLAGVYRSLFDDAVADKYFGYVEDFSGVTQASRIITYDATLQDKSYFVKKRDCVGLDEWRTAITGNKFDFEVLEPGVKFVTYMEQDVYQDDVCLADVIADAWTRDRILLGAKTMRGHGRVKDVKISAKAFDMTDSADVQAWLDFDMYDYKCWQGDCQWVKDAELCSAYDSDDIGMELSLDLIQEGPLVIRVYTTDVSKDENKSLPDYNQITYTKGNVPFIPGTSWAGVFRHRLQELGKVNVESYFGTHKGDKCKSRISFSESAIVDSKFKEISRNAIDRFTGGTVQSALFKEKVVYGGKTSLKITVKGDCDAAFRESLASAIIDLHMGFLTVGGEGSIGYGLFSVDKITCNNSELQVPSKDSILSDPDVATSLYQSIVRAMENADNNI
ncbi:MAG: hypothetical protein IJX85_04675 [Lachnospiraceae bacterium]|nr:hypothetical protein [Lachnospiraceae bacterium]